MRKIYNLFVKYQNIIAYLFFGVLTTVVNFLVYFPLYNWARLPAVISNVLAWSVAVVFAFFTNKPFVFKSNDWTWKFVLPEFFKFVTCRVGSGLLETAAIWLLVDCLMWNGNWVKILVSIFVVIMNYATSKWFVFIGNEKK